MHTAYWFVVAFPQITALQLTLRGCEIFRSSTVFCTVLTETLRFVVTLFRSSCSEESYRLRSSKEIPWLYYTNSTVIWSLCRTQRVTELWHHAGKPSCFYVVWTKWINLSHNGEVFSIPLQACFTPRTDFITSGFRVLNWNFPASLILL